MISRQSGMNCDLGVTYMMIYIGCVHIIQMCYLIKSCIKTNGISKSTQTIQGWSNYKLTISPDDEYRLLKECETELIQP